MAEPRPSDPDGVLLKGCISFTILAVCTFLVAGWPFFVFQESYRSAVLYPNLLYGCIPTMIGGAILCRLLGVVGAGSFLAGFVTFGVFFFLRHYPFIAFANAADMPKLDYPVAYVYLIPLATIVAGLFVTSIFFDKNR